MAVMVHASIASYRCAIEQFYDQKLLKRPLALAPLGLPRVTVLEATTEAVKCGVWPGMLLTTAQKRCPELLAVPPHPDLYEVVNKDLQQFSEQFTPLFAVSPSGQVSLDLTGTERAVGSPDRVVNSFQNYFHKHYRFRESFGQGSNLLVAQVSSQVTPPFHHRIIAPGTEQPFLAPLPSRLLPDLEAWIYPRFKVFNFRVMDELARCSLKQLRTRVLD